MFQRLAIVGVGLLGGSVAKAIRRADPEIQIHGISRSQSTRDAALKADVIDEAFESIDDGCQHCDVVVVCTPVDRIAAQVIQIAGATPEDCLITDVGSTKAGIVQAVAHNGLSASKFVGAHPIAGSEKTGVQNSSANLFDDKVIIITPTESTTDHRHRQVEHFWSMSGGRLQTMTPELHDQQLAAISHVPHLASALVARLADDSSLPLTGSGWRDITRVAAGDPEMWTAICLQNREAILRELARFQLEISYLTQSIEAGDTAAVNQWLSDAKSLRKRVD